MTALVVFGDDRVSPALQKWLSMCPDVDELKQKVEEYAWLTRRVRCPECGDKETRKDLVLDTNGPYSDGEQLICMHCWDANNVISAQNGLEQDLHPKHARMPPSKVLKQPQKVFVIFNTKRRKIIGNVCNYNTKFHTGKVSLFGMENSAEFGELDPDCEVFDDVQLKNKIGPNFHKKTMAAPADVAFAASIHDF